MSSWNYDRGYDRGYTTRTYRRTDRDNSEAYRDRSGRGTSYYYGSAAPALEEPVSESSRGRDRRTAERPAGSARPAPRRSYFSPAMAALLVAGLCIMAAGFLASISLTTQITNAVEEIADLESELSELKKENEEALNAIETSVSLDDIKYRAITELGMSYADENQIIHYTNEESDYVRQLILPE